jgi:HPr kinase/phosphorylase
MLDAVGESAEITVVACQKQMDREIISAELNRPGLPLAGFLKDFQGDRIQILGNTEMSYLGSLSPEERFLRLDQTFEAGVPCMIVTANNVVHPELFQCAERYQIPLLRSPQPTTRVMSTLHVFLDRIFAETTNIHGDLLDVFGMGTLIIGDSGVGKSECALELIERGHRLAADDQVLIRRINKERVVGSRFENLRYNMEIRGLGILDIELLFGVASVVEEKQIDIIVQLEKWDENKDYERLGIDTQMYSILDVGVPLYVLPVQPGRNISIMVEMAALNQRLKNTGVNPARNLAEQSLLACRQANVQRNLGRSS